MKPIVLMAVCLAACAELDHGDGDDLELDEAVQAVEAEPSGLTTNQMTGNQMTGNQMTGNQMTGNQMTGNALVHNQLMADMTTNATGGLDDLDSNATVRAALTDPDTRMFMKYLVECALPETRPAGRGLVVPASVTLRDAYGYDRTYYGSLGLAPEWRTGPCNQMCQERVTACLLARTNYAGVKTRISVGMSIADWSSISGTRSDIEEAAFQHIEIAAYGNLFRPITTTTPRYLAAAISEENGGGAQYVQERFCAPSQSKTCSVTQTGYTYVAVAPECWGPSGHNQQCVGGDGSVDNCFGWDHCTSSTPGPNSSMWNNPITVYRANTTLAPPPGTSIHAEHLSGAKMPDTASPCAWKIIHGWGDAPALTGCRDTTWGASCINAARDRCGDHSLCTTGDPLSRGDSACIDLVCADTNMPECCSTGWTAACVTRARHTCAACPY